MRLAGREISLASLYAGGIAGMRPKPADLTDLDVLLFDVQDIGARFYTYLASMAMALENQPRPAWPSWSWTAPIRSAGKSWKDPSWTIPP